VARKRRRRKPKRDAISAPGLAAAQAPSRSTRPPEAPRDQETSGFTAILRKLWRSRRKVLAVAFVDYDGECVDYCSSLAPYDAKIVGAYMHMVLTHVADSTEKLGHGAPRTLIMHAEAREIVVRKVSPEYWLVVLVRAGGLSRGLLAAIERAVLELRSEAGLASPDAEASADAAAGAGPALVVELRTSRGWPYAPSAFSEHGLYVPILAVLGRWVEEEDARDIVCFRVRTDSGEEMTLAHDIGTNVWKRV